MDSKADPSCAPLLLILLVVITLQYFIGALDARLDKIELQLGITQSESDK